MTQHVPIGSDFGSSTTASEVIRGLDWRGKIAIVTDDSGVPTFFPAKSISGH